MLQFALGLRQGIGRWLNGRKATQPHSFRGPVSEKKSVLIVCDINDEADRRSIVTLKSKIKELCPKASVNIAGCYNKNSKIAYNLISDEEDRYFSEEKLSFFFKFKDLGLLDFLQAGYDVALFVFNPGNLTANYASTYVISALRVGWTNSELDKSGFLNLCLPKSIDRKVSIDNIVETLGMLFA